MDKDTKDNNIEAELPKPHRKIEKRRMNIDVYFQALLKKDEKVKAHHKAAIKVFLQEKGLTEATEEEFDRAFRLY